MPAPSLPALGTLLVRGFVSLMLCGLFLAIAELPTADAQNKTTKKSKASKAAEEEEKPSQFEELTFGSLTIDDKPGQADADDTPAGRDRLNDVTSRAKEIFRERDTVERNRRPLAGPRDVLVGECVICNQHITEAQELIGQCNFEIQNLQGQNSQNAINQIRQYQMQIANARTVVAFNQQEIEIRKPRIDALNLQIQPLDQRLVKLWGELNNSRKQWLEVRQPHRKYAFGDIESLKTVLDDWLLIDGLWPEAFAWAALCAFERGEYQDAWDFVDKAEEVRKTLNYSKAWAQGEALRGMIAARIPARKGKSAGHLTTAGIYANKNKRTDWEVPFLLGRAAFDNEKTAAKAKANFEKALKISPDENCIRYWNARLQTTSTATSVRDVEAGTKTLEKLWEKSSKKSWRLSYALVLAYDAYDRDDDAKKMWKTTLELAPSSEHSDLEEARAKIKEKGPAGTDKPKSAKSKS